MPHKSKLMFVSITFKTKTRLSKVWFSSRKKFPNRFKNWDNGGKNIWEFPLDLRNFRIAPSHLHNVYRHAFLPQVRTYATFPTLKMGGGIFFSKYFYQGSLKNFLHSNKVCMYFGFQKTAIVDLWKLNNIYNEAIMIFTTSI